MRETKNEKNYDNRKKILLDKIKKIYSQKSSSDYSYKLKSSIGIRFPENESPSYRIDYNFFGYSIINSVNISIFKYKTVRKIDGNEEEIVEYCIGFWNLSEEEINILDSSRLSKKSFSQAGRGSENGNLYLQAICATQTEPIVNISSEQIYDTILYDSLEDIDFQYIVDIFGEFYFLKIENSLIIEDDIRQNFYYTLCKLINHTKLLISLPYNNEILEEIAEILEESHQINYVHLFDAMTALTWNYAFLMFYKIFESLYPIFFYRDLSLDTMTKGISMVKFSYLLEKHFKVRPNDMDSIKNAFNVYMRTEAGGNLEKLKKLFKISDSDSLPQQFYQLRNSCVHGRWIFDPKHLTYSDNSDQFEEKKNDKCNIDYHTLPDEDWFTIIEELLQIIIMGLNDAVENNLMASIQSIKSTNTK